MARGIVVTDDLEPLDPRTGEPLVTFTPEHADRPGLVLGWRAHRRRVRRLRILAIGLAVASAAHILLAASLDRRIDAVRRIESIWREAVAIDDIRRDLMADVAGLPSMTGAAILSRVGAGERVQLDDLADEMERLGVPSALEPLATDARLAIRAHIRLLLRTPYAAALPAITDVDERIDRELERRLLDPATAPEVELVQADLARQALARYTTERTSTVLVVGSPGAVHLVDIDNQLTRTRNLSGTPEIVLGREGYVVVLADGVATGYPLDPGRPHLWSTEADQVFADTWDDETTAWVVTGDKVMRYGPNGSSDPPFVLPPGAEVLGDTWSGLIVRTGDTVSYLDDLGTLVPMQPPPGRVLGVVRHGVVVDTDGLLGVQEPRTGQRVPMFAWADGAQWMRAAPDGNAVALVGEGGRVTLAIVGDSFGRPLDGPVANLSHPDLAWSPHGQALFYIDTSQQLVVSYLRPPSWEVVRAPVEQPVAISSLPSP